MVENTAAYPRSGAQLSTVCGGFPQAQSAFSTGARTWGLGVIAEGWEVGGPAAGGDKGKYHAE